MEMVRYTTFVHNSSAKLDEPVVGTYRMGDYSCQPSSRDPVSYLIISRHSDMVPHFKKKSEQWCLFIKSVNDVFCTK